MDREALIQAMTATAAAAAKPRSVKVPKWGTVYVRELTVDQVEEQSEDDSEASKKHRIARGVARILCDESGKLLFDPDKPEDVAFLGKQPWGLLRKITKDDDEGN